MFKTELHCHSKEVSECAQASARELVRLYKDAGYSTVVLTNHFATFTYNYLNSRSWQDWIDKYLSGYELLKNEAKGVLEVLFAIEIRPIDSPNDYLLYGISERLLRESEGLYLLSVKNLSNFCRQNGVLMIQAHPFREGMQMTPNWLLDGIEVFNGSIGGHYATDSNNDRAKAYAEHFKFIKTSGSDLHYSTDKILGGIKTEEKITSVNQLVDILKSGKYTLIEENA